MELAPETPAGEEGYKGRPLHSGPAERVVLGMLLVDNSKIDELPGGLVAKDFYDTRHQIIFQHIILQHSEHKVPADVIVVGESLATADQLAAAGGSDYLGDLAQEGSGAPNFDQYVRMVREYSILRDLLEQTRQIGEDVHTRRSETTVDQIVDDAERRIFDLNSRFRDERGDQTRLIKHIASDVHKEIERLHERFEAGKPPYTGLVTGYLDLDNISSGLQPGELTILAARPSIGKTSLALDIVRNVCTTPDEDDNPRGAAFFSLEMSANQLAIRLMSVVSGIDQHRIRTGKLDQHSDWDKFLEASDKIDKWRMWIDESTVLTVNDLRAQARRIKREAEREGSSLNLIVIDYLQLMVGSGQERLENRTLEVSAISRGLKGLARELQVPVLALSQMSRRVEDRPNHRPVLSDLRESGSIEQDADLIIFLANAKTSDGDVGPTREVDMIVGKNRNGPIGTYKLLFKKAQAHFEQMQAGVSSHDYDAAEYHSSDDDYNSYSS